MNKLIRNCFVVFLVLMTGMVWLDAQAAKPVKVTVESAFPGEADQGDLIDVEIEGTGFDDGSTARFIVTDSRDDTQIDVQQVTYIGPGKLKAKIKVKDAALVIDYDIEVTTSSGRRGKGTTMFRVQERVGTDDPCTTSLSPFPAFMFWQRTNRPTNPEYTIYLASEDGLCIRALLDVPDSGNAWTWESSFAYDQATEHGYVVWSKGGWGDDEAEIWLQEFTVDGNTMDLPRAPERIVDTDPSSTDDLLTHARNLDISADLENLAFVMFQGSDHPSEIHVVNIASCRPPYQPCVPSADTLILKEGEGSFPADTLNSWDHVSWGPLGKRIYLQVFWGDALGVNQSGIHMITLTEGSWAGERIIEDRELLTTFDYPEYTFLSRLHSGVSGGREKLAFRHDGADCATISVIDVIDCEAGPTENNSRPCEAESQFFGINPSWSDRGTIIHEIIELVKKHPRKEIYECRFIDFIGEWDPLTSELTPLVEGENPDA